MARTTHVSNGFPWSQRCSSHLGSTVHIQTVDRRGGSDEYPQSMFFSKNKKNNVYPCKPQFYYIKWGLRGSILNRHVFVMYWTLQRTGHICVMWGCIRVKGDVSRQLNLFKPASSFSADLSKAFTLLEFFACASMFHM